MKTILGTLVIVLVAGILGALAVSYSGAVSIAAAEEESGILEWFLHNTYERSVSQSAASINRPTGLNEEERVLAGARSFEEMCVTCHRAPGQEATPVSRGLNPPAPDLADIASHRSLEQAFWLIKHGVRMTGMAAFGLSHEDEELWNLVAFIGEMEDATESDYLQLMERVPRGGSRDDGHDHEH